MGLGLLSHKRNFGGFHETKTNVVGREIRSAYSNRRRDARAFESGGPDGKRSKFRWRTRPIRWTQLLRAAVLRWAAELFGWRTALFWWRTNVFRRRTELRSQTILFRWTQLLRRRPKL